MGEVKNNKVSGFHNWLSFLKEEGEGDLDYKGYLKKLDLGNKVQKNSSCSENLSFSSFLCLKVQFSISLCQ